MNTANIITIIVIIFLILLISFPLIKRIRSKETCCGTEKVKVKHKKLKNPAGSYRLHIDGMHCKNCEKRITEAINSIEGLACKVSLEKKEAVVSYEHEPRTEAVIKLLGDMDFLAELVG
ncbi:MAG: heavy-metal-associated domain-containing protein [Lachnospiraceae bacterium]|nr:heavy-metal-associated domain-containing protein [Lachnospiraceae bacterium]